MRKLIAIAALTLAGFGIVACGGGGDDGGPNFGVSDDVEIEEHAVEVQAILDADPNATEADRSRLTDKIERDLDYWPEDEHEGYLEELLRSVEDFAAIEAGD